MTEPSLVRKLSRFKLGFTLTALFVALCLPSFVAGETRIPADTTISDAKEWNTTGSPFVVEGLLTIASGGKLVIDSGVEVRMDNSSSAMIVDGDLQVLGTTGSPVLFTSPSKQPGSWQSITIINPAAFDATAGTGTILQGCIIEYGGGSNVTGALILNGTALPSMNDLRVRHAENVGVFVGEGASLNLQNISVSDCGVGIASNRPSCSGTLSCVLSNVVVTNCSSGLVLQALDTDVPQITLQQCSFKDNNVSVQLWNISQPVTFNNCEFNGSAYGIWAYQSSFTINGCEFLEQTEASVFATGEQQSNSSVINQIITTSNFIDGLQGVRIENPNALWYSLSVLGNNFVRLTGPALYLQASSANSQARTLVQGNNFVQNRPDNYTIYFEGLPANDSQPLEFVKNVIAQNALDPQAIAILYADIPYPVSIPSQIWGNRFTQNSLANSSAASHPYYPAVIALRLPDVQSEAVVVRFNRLDNPDLDTELSLLSASSSVPCFDQEVDATRNFWGADHLNLTSIRDRILDALVDAHRPLAKIFPFLIGSPSNCSNLEYVSPVLPPSNGTNATTVTAPPLTSPTSTSTVLLTTTSPNITTTVALNETTTTAQLNVTTTIFLNETTTEATTVVLSTVSTLPENFTTGASSVAGQVDANITTTVGVPASTTTDVPVPTSEFNLTTVPTTTTSEGTTTTTTVELNATTTAVPNVTTTTTPPVTSSGIVGEWALGSANNETVPDLSGNGNDAIVANVDPNGVVNSTVSDALRSLYFFPQLSQPSVILPQLNLPFNNSGDFSLSAWILPYSAQQLDTQADSGSDGFIGQQFVVGPPNGSANVPFPDNSTCDLAIAAGANGVSVYCFGGLDYFAPLLVAPLSIDNWTLINVVVANNTPSVYCNGSFIATGVPPDSRTIIFPSGVIGGSEFGPFEGLIAFVRADNISLNANQTADIFHQVFPNEPVGIPVPPEEQCQALLATGPDEDLSIFYLRADNSTGLRGVLRGYEILSLDRSPYYLDSEVRVASKATLVVEKGVTVIAQSGSGFSVYGALQALGNPDDIIVFQSDVRNDTVDEFIGCLNVQGGELPYPIFAAAEFNRTECRLVCELAGYEYYAVFAGNSCSCGNAVADQWRVSDTRCNISCANESDVSCGGDEYLSVYRTAVGRHFRGLTFGCSQRYPGSSVLDYVQIINSGSAYDAAVQICGQSPILANLEIFNSTGQGIHHFGLLDPVIPAQLTNVSIQSCSSDCLYFEGKSCSDGCTFRNVSCDHSLRRALYISSSEVLANDITVSNCSFTNNGFVSEGLTPNVTFSAIELTNLTGASVILRGCNITDNAWFHSVYVFEASPVIEQCYFGRNGWLYKDGAYAIYLESMPPSSSLSIVENTFDANVGAIRLSGQLYANTIQNISYNSFYNNSGSSVLVDLPSDSHETKSGLRFLFEHNVLTSNSILPGRALVALDPSCCAANENYTFSILGNVFDSNQADGAALLWFLGDQYNETNDLISENIFSSNLALAAIELPRVFNSSVDAPHRVPLHYNKFLNSTDTNYTIKVDELYRWAPFNASLNYWDTRRESTIRSKIWDYSKNRELELVTIFPWLLSTNDTDVALNASQPNCSAINYCSDHGECITPSVCYCDLGWSGQDCANVTVTTTTTTTGPTNATSSTNATSPTTVLLTTTLASTTATSTSTLAQSSSALSTPSTSSAAPATTASTASTSSSSSESTESTVSTPGSTESTSSGITSATTAYSTPIFENNCAFSADQCGCPQSVLNGCVQAISNRPTCVQACTPNPIASDCINCLFSASPRCANCACYVSCTLDNTLVAQYCKGAHSNCAV